MGDGILRADSLMLGGVAVPRTGDDGTVESYGLTGPDGWSVALEVIPGALARNFSVLSPDGTVDERMSHARMAEAGNLLARYADHFRDGAS